MKQEIKEKINMEILIKQHMKHETTAAATAVKYLLIMDLINKETKYIDIINYYYDIKNKNNTQE